MHNDVVDSDNAATTDPDMDGHGSSCCNHESLLITAMNSHRSTASAEAPARGEPAVPFLSGASKSIMCPSPPQMEKMIVFDSESDALTAAGASNQSSLLLDDNDMSQPVVSASLCLGGMIQDHTIDGAVSDDHGRDGNKTKRGKKRLLSLCNRSHCQRNNNNGHKSRVLSVMVLSLCWMSFAAAANVFPNATTTQAAVTTSTAVASTTVAPLTTKTTTSSSVIDDNISTTAGTTTTTAATIITNATTTAATTTTTTVGGLKLIEDDDDVLPACRTFTNRGKCQQYEECTWIGQWGPCDFAHLPVTSTSPPTTMNSRAPPTSDAPSPQPTSGTTTIPPVVVPTTPSPVPGGGGTKVITDSPTLQPSPPPSPLPTKLPTALPTPKPTTKSPTPLPTVEPTTKAPTEIPTVRPTTKAPTEEPTDIPTYSPTLRPTPMPSRNPTPNPTNSPTPKPTPKPSPVPSVSPSGTPSVSPSASPTVSPSDFPSTTPTAFPTISPKPTPLVWPSASPTLSSSPTVSPSSRPSSSPTGSPSSIPTLSPTTPSPIAADETTSPTVAPITPPPTPPATSALQRVLIEKEPTSITLKNAYKMRKGSAAYVAWDEATKDRIGRYTQELIEETSGEKDVDVVVTIEEVVQSGEQQGSGRRRLGGRVLQEVEGPSNPLRLSFRTTLEFYSKESKWDGSDLIAAGFIEPSQQTEYISELQKKEQGSFGTVKSMAMSVNGRVVTKETDAKPLVESNSMVIIIAGAVSGVLVLLAIAGGVYYVKRRNNRRNSGFVNKGKKSSSSDFYNGSGNTGTMMSSPPTKSFPPPPPQTASPVGDYFGTIEPRPGEDDVSTLGDPYIGDVHVNQAMGGDNTVTESLMSSGNDMYVYGISRPRMNTGDSSRMGGSTINTNGNRMTFQDDGTIEEFYGTPDATNFHSEKDSNFEHITVVASSGVLGIVIDNPSRTTPVVHAIKESSILNGRVHVGDLLMSVDEVDCRGMTAVAVSKLIGSRSQNPMRTLRLLRGATLDDFRGDSIHMPF
eukprot:CAMPEP_0113417722 /NCGR_PEP_ID=MMETSP0013_2-20120614/25805_1 /TAXON_ID=2843 ORGANISM="Skeletonema costatum, Strain 1716" /NCGR_SAMPLE_ID=MMETSP0013_2 /ASSEMBLY_ACC=CAM_ASM_000158 /LENGTH=1019 /DNA_ID=CAMNT_0000304871 /DNA_START=141 /DNA_END=3200 /DNA_ORIENTATION=+ /assembly_acc=CAM_ASM_000158